VTTASPIEGLTGANSNFTGHLPPVRIAYGTTVLQRTLHEDALDGIGRYVDELRACLVPMSGFTLRPFVFTGGRLQLGKADGVTDAGSFVNQALFSLGVGWEFPSTARSLAARVDLIHATDHFIPKLRGVPVVASLLDAIPLSHPELVSYSFKGVKTALWKKSAQWADHVITISEDSKKEIIRWFGVAEDKISVTPLGVSRRWFAEIPPGELDRVRQAHQLPESYFLFVGTLQPRKNLHRVIAAHRSLPASVRRETPLVVAGRAGWNCSAEVAALDDGDGGTLRWLKHVPEKDLLTLYKLSSALVFPSLVEGFGLPVLEAFAAGVPVVTSNTTSLPGVAGDAALLVDPCDTGAIAEAMRTCLEDTALVDALRTRGRERARQFTWERTAQLTADVYRRVLGC
jgi:alpha-1,3-rhamnosyl/mannosyltransferase